MVLIKIKDGEKMDCNALQQVVNLARKSPRMLFNLSFFEKICQRLEIDSEITNGKLICTYKDRQSQADIITAQNCQDYKCSVKEGVNGIRIFEFILILVDLFLDEKIPASPHEGAGSTAQYYVEEGTKALQKLLL